MRDRDREIKKERQRIRLTSFKMSDFFPPLVSFSPTGHVTSSVATLRTIDLERSDNLYRL